MLLDYFKKTYSEVQKLGDIRWSHAVNSLEKLERSINDPRIMFIESDIRVSLSGEIIAAHPPELTSDLKYPTLLNKVKVSKQGLKLDFKDPEILVHALHLLQEAELSQPVLLNADILGGNNAPRAKFVPEAFLALAKKYYPQGILSIGWTTNTTDPYTSQNIEEMLKLLENYDQDVTFPVRACLIPSSWDQLKRLLDNPLFSLSIWNNEPVTDEQLIFIKQNIPADKAFFDFIDENKDPLKLI